MALRVETLKLMIRQDMYRKILWASSHFVVRLASVGYRLPLGEPLILSSSNLPIFVSLLVTGIGSEKELT
jgi:hypothetical protein